jgi:RNA polymerase sigma-70 factor (ECF subfamily)
VEAILEPTPPGLLGPPARNALRAFTDAELVDQARGGSRDALEVLYDRHHRGVLSFCRHMLRSAGDASEATRNVFVAAFDEVQHAGECVGDFSVMLYTVARSHCLDLRPAERDDLAGGPDLGFEYLSDDVRRRPDLQDLLSRIGRLPREQREALVLSEVADLSEAEMAAVLGLPEPAVKELIFEARTSMTDHPAVPKTPCGPIRREIATLRDPAAHPHVGEHLVSCYECAEYEEAIDQQCQMLALALPVVPSLSLRHDIFGDPAPEDAAAAARRAPAVRPSKPRNARPSKAANPRPSGSTKKPRPRWAIIAAMAGVVGAGAIIAGQALSSGSGGPIPSYARHRTAPVQAAPAAETSTFAVPSVAPKHSAAWRAQRRRRAQQQAKLRSSATTQTTTTTTRSPSVTTTPVRPVATAPVKAAPKTQPPPVAWPLKPKPKPKAPATTTPPATTQPGGTTQTTPTPAPQPQAPAAGQPSGPTGP